MGHIGENQLQQRGSSDSHKLRVLSGLLLMYVLRCIFFFSATFDFNLTAAHIPGCYNTLADAISRNKHVLKGYQKGAFQVSKYY